MAQESLRFLTPSANAVTALGASPNYTLGSNVPISWQTSFDQTTLEIWQGPLGSGVFVTRTLAANCTQDQTSYTWEAGKIDGVGLEYPFHFELSASDAGAGGRSDSAGSVEFYLSSPSSSNIASTATSSASSSSAMSATTTSSTAAISGAAASDNANLTQSRSRVRAIGLGVGLGLGFPLILALLALLAFCLLLRRRKRHDPQRHPSHRSRPSISRPMMQTDEQPLSPQYPPAAYHSVARKHRYSTATSASVASSYHGPFEFERPGSENFDQKSVMSEIDRQSLRGAGSSDARSVSVGSVGNGNGAGRSSASLHGSTTPKRYPRLTSIDEDARPETPPGWPLR